MPRERSENFVGRDVAAGGASRARLTPFHLAEDGTCEILIVLFPGFPLGDLARLLDVFHGANDLASRSLFDWRIASVAGTRVTSSAGIAIDAEEIGDLDPRANVVTLGTIDRDSRGEDVLHAWLERHRGAIRRIGNVADGEIDQAAPARNARPDGAGLYWRDGIAFFCRGGCATSDLALSAVERALGAHVARRLLRRIARREWRSGDDPDSTRRTTREGQAPAPVKRALAIMHQNLRRPIPMSRLAGDCGVHLRHLQRLFQSHLGRSPRDYYQRLRLAKARDLVRDTTLRLAEIAEAVGFDSLSHFSRCYLDAFEIRPSADRKSNFTAPIPARCSPTAADLNSLRPTGPAPS